jgi:hypothetical protein
LAHQHGGSPTRHSPRCGAASYAVEGSVIDFEPAEALELVAIAEAFGADACTLLRAEHALDPDA